MTGKVLSWKFTHQIFAWLARQPTSTMQNGSFGISGPIWSDLWSILSDEWEVPVSEWPLTRQWEGCSKVQPRVESTGRRQNTLFWLRDTFPSPVQLKLVLKILKVRHSNFGFHCLIVGLKFCTVEHILHCVKLWFKWLLHPIVCSKWNRNCSCTGLTSSSLKLEKTLHAFETVFFLLSLTFKTIDFTETF